MVSVKFGGGVGFEVVRFFLKRGVIRNIYEACTDDVDAAYSNML